MNPVEANLAIAAAVESGWTTTRVALDGQRFAPEPDESYVVLAIRELLPLFTTHGATGQRITRQRGLAIAQCYAPNGEVDSAIPALELAVAFRDLLHGQSIGADPIHFEAANPKRVGTVGAHYQVNVTIPFAYDERH